MFWSIRQGEKEKTRPCEKNRRWRSSSRVIRRRRFLVLQSICCVRMREHDPPSSTSIPILVMEVHLAGHPLVIKMEVQLVLQQSPSAR
ncbi:unnamed protein product [Amoebophrya sp. A25]|nr:unnamed protein product [Amoebophrya sp. A25]|eukprot:GSA25T00007510001.1